ncbi:ribonucleotide reductase inhibitor-domain-containing protein [Camillea tinctor]|nr:ribonucleotide reductase inhibitor-domain-containing protein [Camillea tinctor]
MSTPRTKRQFAGASRDPAQRQITSFFTTSDNNASPAITQRPSEPSPSLPASVQSNLLSVGMRVRKSVPEGYKTGNYNAFSLWDERTSCAPVASSGRANPVSSTPRELLPFCGIHKVGGLDTQPPHLSIDDTPLEDEIPGLTSSQDSMDSETSTSLPNTRKRVYTDDDDDDADLERHFNVNTTSQSRTAGLDFDGEISPRSLAPAGWSNGRVLAVPRKGGRRARNDRKLEGQENVMVVDTGDDFEEAEFLADSGTWEMDVSDF